MDHVPAPVSIEIQSYIKVPDHILSCANAIWYDLMYGPTFSLIPNEGMTKFTEDHYSTIPEDLDESAGKIEYTYTGTVAETFRNWISENVPAELWIDTFAGDVSTSEPEAWEDENGEIVYPEFSDYFRVDSNDIVRVLFGKTVAENFS